MKKYLLRFLLPWSFIFPCNVFANNESLTSQINELEDDIYTLQSEVITYTSRMKIKKEKEAQQEKTLKGLDDKIKQISENQRKIEQALETIEQNINKSQSM